MGIPTEELKSMASILAAGYLRNIHQLRRDASALDSSVLHSAPRPDVNSHENGEKRGGHDGERNRRVEQNDRRPTSPEVRCWIRQRVPINSQEVSVSKNRLAYPSQCRRGLSAVPIDGLDCAVVIFHVPTVLSAAHATAAIVRVVNAEAFCQIYERSLLFIR